MTFLFSIQFIGMLLLILGLLLFGALTGINLIGRLFKILLFFLLLSVIWFVIKSGFYILLIFAVVYLGIKGITYLRSYVKGNNKSEYKSRRVEFEDSDFVEVVE